MLHRRAPLVRALADAVLPRCCPGCAAPLPPGGRDPCSDCTTALRVTDSTRAGTLTLPGTLLGTLPGSPAGALPKQIPVRAALHYRAPLPALVLAWKERAPAALLAPMAAALAEAIADAVIDGLAAEAVNDCGDEFSADRWTTNSTTHPGVLLVPVPSTPAAVRRRGHDAVGVLAARAARLLSPPGPTASSPTASSRSCTSGSTSGRPGPHVHAPVHAPVHVAALLRHARAVVDQAGLSTVQRQENLAGAFRVHGRRAVGLRGLLVVVVDDVVTSGSTLTEATTALHVAGFRVVGAAALADATRRPRT